MPPANHIAFLDGLRAAAALWVLVGHARLFSIGWLAQKGVVGLATNGALYLHFAVDIFIVLSGYCLILPVLRNNGVLRDGVVTFFAKRARRILPTYYAAMAFCLLLNTFVPYTNWARIRPDYLTPHLPLAVWATNILLVQDLYPQFNLINGPFWSIAVEWHIYFLFPLLVWVGRRFGAIAALLLSAAGAMLLSFIDSHYHPIAVPYYLFLFGGGIFAAMCAGSQQKQKWREIAGLLGFVCLGVWLGVLLMRYPIVDEKTMLAQQQHIVLLDTIVGALTATGLFLLATSDLSVVRFVRNVLSWRPLVFVGGFSYSIYLFHITFMVLIHHYLLEGVLQNWSPTRKYLLLTTVGSVVIVTACYGMYWLFERPFLSRKPKPPA